jgi:hypothetical protein
MMVAMHRCDSCGERSAEHVANPGFGIGVCIADIMAFGGYDVGDLQVELV